MAILTSNMFSVQVQQGNLFFVKQPSLTFSDLDSGPNNGLNDGYGEGTIVTVWGYNLGPSKGSSTLTFTDASAVEHDAAYIYYWKNADGELPGGPANLYESHGLQEVCFSIPAASAVGAGTIKLVVGGVDTNTLPFRVSTVGTIRWVAPGGNNSNPGTFASPKAYINANIGGSSNGMADQNMSAGDICYSMGVDEPVLSGGGRSVGLYVRGCTGTATDLITFVSYPNTRAKAEAPTSCMTPYLSDYLSLHKFDLRCGDVDPATPPGTGDNPHVSANQSNNHIRLTRGRYVGNYFGQIAGQMITGWSGAYVANGNNADGAQMLGGEFDSLGTENTSRYQHTTYISNRSAGVVNQNGFNFSYNYIHECHPMFGFHLYDEYQAAAGWTGQMIISNNIIKDQVGPAINLSPKHSSLWTPEILIENNILISTGLGPITLEDNVAPPPQAIRISGMHATSITVRNNTLYEWSSPHNLSINQGGQAMSISSDDPACVFTIENNIFKSDINYPYINTSETIQNSNNNLFYSSGGTPTAPSWTGNITSDPQLTVTGPRVVVNVGSPVIDTGYVRAGNPSKDTYGNTRITIDVGAVEYVDENLLFVENFDAQADWNPGMGTTPPNWDAHRTSGIWDPDGAYPNSKWDIEIRGDNPDMLKDGIGKSLVTYSENRYNQQQQGFGSDGLLMKDIPPSETVYVEFDIKFQPGWAESITEGGQCKIFRIMHYDGVGPRFSFHPPNSSVSPVYIFDWVQNAYGNRQFHAIRQDPQTNYFYWDPIPSGLPWSDGGVNHTGSGDWTAYYGYNTRNYSPRLINQLTGQELSVGRYDIHWHDEVWSSAWHKFAFYVAQNSAPGVEDGKLQVWLDGAPIWQAFNLAWIAADGDMNRKWNNVTFGGNDNYHWDPHPNNDPQSTVWTEERERWYAFDNIVIRTDIP